MINGLNVIAANANSFAPQLSQGTVGIGPGQAFLEAFVGQTGRFDPQLFGSTLGKMAAANPALGYAIKNELSDALSKMPAVQQGNFERGYNSESNAALQSPSPQYSAAGTSKVLKPGQWHLINYPNSFSFPKIPDRTELKAMSPSERVQMVEALLRNINVYSFLDTISYAEGASYNSLVGDGYVKGNWKFTDYSKHPGYAGTGGQSAAGRYQIQKPVYDQYAPKLGITDFTPHSQDMIAVYIMLEKRSSMMKNLAAGNFKEAIHAGAPEWASLPNRQGKSNYNQRVHSVSNLEEHYTGMQSFHANNALASERKR